MWEVNSALPPLPCLLHFQRVPKPPGGAEMALPPLLEAGKDGKGWERWRNILGDASA